MLTMAKIQDPVLRDLQFGDVERILARTHDIKDRHRKAFQARLRHLRNLGVPRLSKVGSGTRINYNQDDLYELFLALELMRCGMSPATIKYLIRKHRNELPAQLRRALMTKGEEIWFGFCLDHFGGDAGERTSITSGFQPRTELLKFYFGPNEAGPRVSIIMVTRRLRVLHQAAEEVLASNT